jgi:hypothetical protein
MDSNPHYPKTRSRPSNSGWCQFPKRRRPRSGSGLPAVAVQAVRQTTPLILDPVKSKHDFSAWTLSDDGTLHGRAVAARSSLISWFQHGAKSSVRSALFVEIATRKTLGSAPGRARSYGSPGNLMRWQLKSDESQGF